MKWHYFLLVTSVLLSSCLLEEPPIEEDPKAKGIYECFIDGDLFLAKGPNYFNQWSPNPHASYTELSGGFRFSITNQPLDDVFYLLSLDRITSTGNYKLANQTKFTHYDSIECDNYLDYHLSKDRDYFINISKLDLQHDIIVGSFEMLLVNDCISDTIEVLGNFDLEYSL